MRFYSDSSKRIFELITQVLKSVVDDNAIDNDVIQKTIELNSSLCSIFSGSGQSKKNNDDSFILKDCATNKEFTMYVQNYGVDDIKLVEKSVIFKMSKDSVSFKSFYDEKTKTLHLHKSLAEAFIGSMFNLIYDLGLFPFCVRYFSLFTCEIQNTNVTNKNYYSIVENIDLKLADLDKSNLGKREFDIVFKNIIDQYITTCYISAKNIGFIPNLINEESISIDSLQNMNYMNIGNIKTEKQDKGSIMLVQLNSKEFIMLDVYKYILRLSSFGTSFVDLTKASKNIICQSLRKCSFVGSFDRNLSTPHFFNSILQFLRLRFLKLQRLKKYSIDQLFSIENDESLNYIYTVCEQLFDGDVTKATMLKALMENIPIELTDENIIKKFNTDIEKKSIMTLTNPSKIIDVLLDTWQTDDNYVKQQCDIVLKDGNNLKNITVHMRKTSAYVNVKAFKYSDYIILMDDPISDIASKIFVYKFAKSYCKVLKDCINSSNEICTVAKAEMDLYRPSNVIPSMLDVDVSTIKSNLVNTKVLTNSFMTLERNLNMFDNINFTCITLKNSTNLKTVTCKSFDDISTFAGKYNNLFIPTPIIWSNGDIVTPNISTLYIDAYYVIFDNSRPSNILTGDDLLKQNFISNIDYLKDEERALSLQHLPENIIKRVNFKFKSPAKHISKLGKILIYGGIPIFKVFYSVDFLTSQTKGEFGLTRKQNLYMVRLLSNDIYYISCAGDNYAFIGEHVDKFITRLHNYFDNKIQDLILLDNDGVFFGNLNGVKFVSSEYPWDKDRLYSICFYMDNYFNDDTNDAKNILSTWYLSNPKTNTLKNSIDIELSQLSMNVEYIKTFRDDENFQTEDPVGKFKESYFTQNIDYILQFCRSKFAPSLYVVIDDRFSIIKKFTNKSISEISSGKQYCLNSWYEIHKYIYQTFIKFSSKINLISENTGVAFIPCEYMEIMRDLKLDLQFFDYYTALIKYLLGQISLVDYNVKFKDIISSFEDHIAKNNLNLQSESISNKSFIGIKFAANASGFVFRSILLNVKSKVNMLLISYIAFCRQGKVFKILSENARFALDKFGNGIYDQISKDAVFTNFECPKNTSLESDLEFEEKFEQYLSKQLKEAQQINPSEYLKTLKCEKCTMILPDDKTFVDLPDTIETLYFNMSKLVNYRAVKYFKEKGEFLYNPEKHKLFLNNELDNYEIFTGDVLDVLINMKKLYNTTVSSTIKDLSDMNCNKVRYNRTIEPCSVKKSLPLIPNVESKNNKTLYLNKWQREKEIVIKSKN